MSINLNIIEKNGQYYLVHRILGAWTGLGTYGYEVFSLNPNNVVYIDMNIEQQECMLNDLNEKWPSGAEDILEDCTYSTNNDLEGDALYDEMDKAEELWKQYDEDYYSLSNQFICVMDMDSQMIYGDYSFDDLNNKRLKNASMY